MRKAREELKRLEVLNLRPARIKSQVLDQKALNKRHKMVRTARGKLKRLEVLNLRPARIKSQVLDQKVPNKRRKKVRKVREKLKKLEVLNLRLVRIKSQELDQKALNKRHKRARMAREKFKKQGVMNLRPVRTKNQVLDRKSPYKQLKRVMNYREKLRKQEILNLRLARIKNQELDQKVLDKLKTAQVVKEIRKVLRVLWLQKVKVEKQVQNQETQRLLSSSKVQRAPTVVVMAPVTKPLRKWPEKVGIWDKVVLLKVSGIPCKTNHHKIRAIVKVVKEEHKAVLI